MEQGASSLIAPCNSLSQDGRGRLSRSDLPPGWRPGRPDEDVWAYVAPACSRTNRPLTRLLLGHAMHGAEAPDQVAGVDGNDFAGREELGQNVQRDAIVRVIEYGNENNAIRDVEVAVASGQAPAFEDDGRRHEQLNDLEAFAVLIGRGLEPAEILCERVVVFVVPVGLDHRDDLAGRDETRDVVDVTVGIVACDTTSQPDYVANA